MQLKIEIDDDNNTYAILKMVVKQLRQDARLAKEFDFGRYEQLKETAASLDDLAKEYYSVPGTR